MALTDKTFPLRMDAITHDRLLKQASRKCMTITGYLRAAFLLQLEKDEVDDPTPTKTKKRRE